MLKYDFGRPHIEGFLDGDVHPFFLAKSAWNFLKWNLVSLNSRVWGLWLVATKNVQCLNDNPTRHITFHKCFFVSKILGVPFAAPRKQNHKPAKPSWNEDTLFKTMHVVHKKPKRIQTYPWNIPERPSTTCLWRNFWKYLYLGVAGVCSRCLLEFS